MRGELARSDCQVRRLIHCLHLGHEEVLCISGQAVVTFRFPEFERWFAVRPLLSHLRFPALMHRWHRFFHISISKHRQRLHILVTERPRKSSVQLPSASSDRFNERSTSGVAGGMCLRYLRASSDLVRCRTDSRLLYQQMLAELKLRIVCRRPYGNCRPPNVKA